MASQLEFTEEIIQKLFGHEAAEDEDPKRLQQYYFKSSVYNQVITNLPIRILVGHKGIGKSALIKVAMAEDKARNCLSVLIQPNDILNLGLDTSDFLHTIRDWTEGLKEIIVNKVLYQLGVLSDLAPNVKNYRGAIIDFLIETLTNLKSGEYAQDKQDIILEFATHPQITVYVDDLDRGWQGRREDITRISALLNAVRDLSNNNRSINFKIALRSDVYYLVRTSDESTDKIEGSVIWHTWTNHEIFVLLVKRVETFFGRKIDETALLGVKQASLAKYLHSIMEQRFSGAGHWENAPMYRVLMSLIRKRPRDLVKLCTLAARHAYSRKSSLIMAEDLKAIFEEYSQGRVQDTINEYRSELPEIERLLMSMRPSRRERTTREGYVYRTDTLMKKIDTILEGGQFRFTNGKPAGSKELAAFLYKINFLTARKESSNGIIRKYFEENRYLSSQFVDFGFDWEVHPAYRWALQPTELSDIYASLQLSADG